MYRLIELDPLHVPEAYDTYDDFDAVYPADVRIRIADSIFDAATKASPDIDADDILVSGFDTEPTPDFIKQTDAYKLSVKSAVTKGVFLGDHDGEMAFNGDDSNLNNITEREIQELREKKLKLFQHMQDADDAGRMTQSLKNQYNETWAEINRKIVALSNAQQGQDMPVYYATRHKELLNEDPEYNPLAYVRDLPGTAYIAAYDRISLLNACVLMSEKMGDQIRIATFGSELMKHCLVVARFDITV